MLEKIGQYIREKGLNFYDLAVMTNHGIQTCTLQPSNRCNNSYSIAKAFTMTGIGVLADQGKVNAEDRLTDLLKEVLPDHVESGWENVTIGHALKHTLGIAEEFLDIDSCDPNDFGTKNYLERIFSQKLPYQPGTVRVYNDAGFYLLGRVIHAITGETSDRFLMHSITGPMDFSEIAWSICPQGHPMAGTGLYAAAKDIVKLGWLYLNRGQYFGKRLLSEKWVDQVLTRGYELEPLIEDPALIGKKGMNGQMLCFDPERRMAIAWHSFETEDGSFVPDLLNLFKELYDSKQ